MKERLRILNWHTLHRLYLASPWPYSNGGGRLWSWLDGWYQHWVGWLENEPTR